MLNGVRRAPEGNNIQKSLSTPFSVSGADPEETILNAFKVFDPEGKGVLKAD